MTKKKKSVVVTIPKKNVTWAGATDLMQTYGEKDQTKRNSLLVVSKALEISPFGVNLLGGLPYINNLGLREKSFFDYHQGANFEYNWVKRSETDEDKAICEARIIFKGKPITPWVAGEASPASMKMSTLRGFQNHMAQTRAENRCIKHLDGVRIHLELLAGIQKMKGVDEKVTTNALAAVSVSAEEMSDAKPSPISSISTQKTDASDPVRIAESFIKTATSPAQLLAAKKKITESDNFNDSNKRFLVNLIDKRLKR